MSNTFIPYQVDYSVKNTAKTFGPSKKKVIFKFGFASDNAVNDGQTGPACRGSEHELVFIWSLKSGKRQLILDNKDLHFSESGQNGWTSDRAWQHAFTLRDPMSKKQYRVHFLSQPVVKEEPQQHGGFTAPTTTVSRPFDLKIGGLSYFEFNPIYQLGTDRMVTGDADRAQQRHHKHRSGRDSPMDYEERRQLEAAKLASLQEMQQREQKQVEGVTEVIQKLQRQEDPLISFDDDPIMPVVPQRQPPTQVVTAPVPGSSSMTNNNQNNYFASSITLDPMIDSSAQLQPPGSLLTNPYGSSAAPAPPANNNNPYGGTANPYGAAGGTGTSLVPYSGGQQQQTYVDATGRVSVQPSSYTAQQQPSYGNTNPQQQQQQQPSGMYHSTSSNMNYAGQSSQSTLNYSSSTNQNPYGSSPPPMYPTTANTTTNIPYNNNASNPNMMYNNNNNNMVSPQNSAYTYGSAPSFAQPPPRPPQPNNNNYGGGGGYPPQQPSYNY